MVFYILFCVGCIIYSGSYNQAQATLWFLGVGNDGYITDIDGLWSTLNSQSGSAWSGLNDDQVHIRSDLSGANILSECDWLVSGATAGDTVMFFYSGHATHSLLDYNGDETSSGSWAETSYDEGIGIRNDTYFFSDDDMASVLSTKADGVNVITLFDTCYSGGLVGGTSDLNTVSDIAVLASSMEDQNSWGSTTYSLFTEVLIEALDQALIADADGDNQLLLNEWFAYAADSLSESVMTPQFYTNLSDENMPVILHIVPIPGTLALFFCPVAILAMMRKYKIKNLS